MAIDLFPLGQASGYGSVCYEHIHYIDIYLRTCTVKLFKKILSSEIIPTQFKQCLIIVFHTVQNKSTLDRAIILMSAISKLYEKELKIIAEMFRDMKCRVRHQVLASEYMEVKQFTRQGSLISLFSVWCLHLDY